MPGGLAEEPSEDRRTVEAREAQPVDRAVEADERGAVPIGEQCVVGDRARTHRWRSSTRSATDGGVDVVVVPRRREPRDRAGRHWTERRTVLVDGRGVDTRGRTHE